MMNERVYDLEDRLIEFASRIIDVVEALPNTRAGIYIANQLVRCGLAPALLYGEAQAAESRVCLKLIRKKEMIKPIERLNYVMKENEELIAISSKSIHTAKQNIIKSKKEKAQ